MSGDPDELLDEQDIDINEYSHANVKAEIQVKNKVPVASTVVMVVFLGFIFGTNYGNNFLKNIKKQTRATVSKEYECSRGNSKACLNYIKDKFKSDKSETYFVELKKLCNQSKDREVCFLIAKEFQAEGDHGGYMVHLKNSCNDGYGAYMEGCYEYGVQLHHKGEEKQGVEFLKMACKFLEKPKCTHNF